MKSIGPSFLSELTVAGLLGLPFTWGSDGEIQFDPRMTPAQIAAVQAVYAAHDPTKPAPPPPPSPLAATLQNATTLADLKAVLLQLIQRVT